MEIMTFIVDGYLTHKDNWTFGWSEGFSTLQESLTEKTSGLHGNRRDIGPWKLSIYDFRREKLEANMIVYLI